MSPPRFCWTGTGWSHFSTFPVSSCGFRWQVTLRSHWNEPGPKLWIVARCLFAHTIFPRTYSVCIYIYICMYISVCIVCIYIYITWLSWFSAHFYLGEIPRLKSVMLNSHLLSANQTWFEWKSSILDDFPTQTCMEFGDVQMVYSCIHVYSCIFPLYPIYPHYIPSGLS